MTDTTHDCLRCKVPLEQGYLLDTGQDMLKAGMRHQARWIAGPPEPNFWTGLKLSDRVVRLVYADRCPRCGTLELRAN